MHTLTLTPSLLVIEDDPYFQTSLIQGFKIKGYEVSAVGSKAEFEEIESAEFDFALLDLRLKSDSGLALIAPILAMSPHCQIVILTGYSSIATAVEAIKKGAVNYLMKPASIDEIEAALHQKYSPQTQTITSLDQHEQEYIEYVMQKSEGNISKAAKWLKIHRQSLQRKLKRIGLR